MLKQKMGGITMSASGCLFNVLLIIALVAAVVAVLVA